MARPRKTNAKSTKLPTPPPTSEQKRLRRKDPSVVPSAPYLLASKLLDVACDAPVLHTVCPPNGWRSAVGEWGVFPHGKLSHSYDSYFGGDVDSDVTYEDFMRAAPVSSRTSNQLQATLGNYYKFAFQTSSTTLCDLTNPLALCVLCALVLMIRIFKKMFMPRFSSLGKRLGRAAHGPGWENGNQDRIVKFGEYVYRLIYHSCVSAYGLWYFRDKSWWNNDMGGTKNLWMLHPNHPVEPGMAWYYLVQCAYNVDALLSLILLSFTVEWVCPVTYSSACYFLRKDCCIGDMKQTRYNQIRSSGQKPQCDSEIILQTPVLMLKWSPTVRGDFREMIIHHIITNLLVLGSSYFRFTRIGSMIFLVHDWSELPIELSKLFNFVKWKVASAVCFSIMLVMWVVARLGIFPFLIFRSLLLESYEFLVEQGTMDPAFYSMHVVPFTYLLGGLISLHIMWFFILLRIGWTLVSKGEAHDYSEHKNGEDQTDKKTR